MLQIRTVLAWSAFILSIVVFIAHGVYLVWLDIELTRRGLDSRAARRQPPDPSVHTDRQRALLLHWARANAWSMPIWLGAIVLGTGLWWILHP